MAKRGWQNESQRHSVARKGIKTKYIKSNGIPYDEKLAMEYLFTPNMDELKFFQDKKRRTKLELYAMEHSDEIIELGKKLLNDEKIWSGTKEQIKDNLKFLKRIEDTRLEGVI